MIASHVTGLGSLLTEPGAVIKFSHFSIHPSTCMLYWIQLYLRMLHSVKTIFFIISLYMKNPSL